MLISSMLVVATTSLGRLFYSLITLWIKRALPNLWGIKDMEKLTELSKNWPEVLFTFRCHGLCFLGLKKYIGSSHFPYGCSLCCCYWGVYMNKPFLFMTYTTFIISLMHVSDIKISERDSKFPESASVVCWLSENCVDGGDMNFGIWQYMGWQQHKLLPQREVLGRPRKLLILNNFIASAFLKLIYYTYKKYDVLSFQYFKVKFLKG